MRFLGYKLQFWTIIFAFRESQWILPCFLVNIFSWAANALLCFSASLWILELVDDFFFRAKIDKKDKAVLITGCDSGFGNATAKLLHRRGFTIFACCLDRTSQGAVELRETCGERVKIVQLDVTKEESVQEAVRFVDSNLGDCELWAVINNAGILKGFQVELSSMKDFEDCIQVNALGMIRVSKAFLPHLRRSTGRVVNVCSMAGRFRLPLLGAYSVSKTAAVAFTEVLRQDMREFGVRAISIEPDFYKTPMCSEKNLQRVLEQSLSQVTDEEVKSAYGSNYIEKAQEFYKKVFLYSSSNLQKVFDAIESAVILENPADIYKPCRNLLFKAIYMLGERVAICFVDQTFMILQYIMGVPPPATGVGHMSRIFRM